MKKFLLLAALSATTFFTSCNSNDDDSDSTKTSKELLVGTWKIKESGSIVDGKEISEELNSCEFKSETTFSKDNNFKEIYYEFYNDDCHEEKSTGKWSLDGNKLTIIYDEDNDDDTEDDDNDTTTIETLTKEELKVVISYSDGDKDYTIFTRVN